MKSILNLLLKRVFVFIVLDFILFLLLIILFFISKTFNEPIFSNKIFNEPTKDSLTIVVPDSNVQATNSELSIHNTKLISTLQLRESLGSNSILSETDGLRQTRSIYIGILAALLTFIFGKNNNYKVYRIPLILIIIFYGLDLHLEDLIRRSTYFNEITSNSLDSIVTQKPYESIWYEINYTQRNLQFDNFHNSRIVRKFNAIFDPDIAQSVFYISPLIVVYILLTLRYRKKLKFK